MLHKASGQNHNNPEMKVEQQVERKKVDLLV